MTDKYQNKYRIPSARLQNWDYGTVIDGSGAPSVAAAGIDCVRVNAETANVA